MIVNFIKILSKLLKLIFSLPWVFKGVVLETKKKYPEAIVCYDTAIKLNPNYDNAWVGKGVALDNLQKYPEAIVCYDTAIKLNPNYDNAWYNKGVALANLQKYPEAIECHDTAIRLNPKDLNAWVNKGFAKENQQKYPEAIECYDKAIKLNDKRFEPWVNKGHVLQTQGKHSEAIVCYDTAIRLNSNDSNAWTNKGNVLQIQGKHPEAVVCYNKAIELNGENLETWNNKGFSLCHLKQYSEAIACFQQVIKLNPKNAESYINLGYIYFTVENYQQALENYNTATQLADNNIDAWIGYGDTLYILQNYLLALNAYNQVIKLDSKIIEGWQGKGKSLYKQETYEEALTSFEKVIEIDAENHETWYYKGIIFTKLQRYSEALTPFQNAINLYPDYFLAWSGKGIALNYLKRFSESIAYFEQAIKLNHFFYQAWLNKSVALYSLEKYTQAIACGDISININPDDCEGWIHRIKSVYPASNPIKSSLAKKHPQLKSIKIEGAEATFKVAVSYITKEKDPLGWGLLHYTIAEIYYAQRYKNFTPVYWLKKAKEALNLALKTLNSKEYPIEYLEIIEFLIKIHFELNNTKKVQFLTRIGSSVLDTLLNHPECPTYKKRQLRLRFISFRQLTVDDLVKQGKLEAAWELAEKDKNACLSWYFDTGWRDADKIQSPKFNDLTKLVKPLTAIIYWHLSPVEITTFIVTCQELLKIEVISQPIINFELWYQEWQDEYQSYCKTPSDQRSQHSWRVYMPDRLAELKAILKINTIREKLPPEVTELILIPSRDLHLLPLDYLFSRNIRYLPSVKAGMNRLSPIANVPYDFMSLESTDGGLDMIRLEMELVSKQYNNPKRLNLVEKSLDDSELLSLKEELQQGKNILQVNCHSQYIPTSPEESACKFNPNYELTYKHIYQMPEAFSNYVIALLLNCETSCTGNQTITTEYIGLSSVLLSHGIKNVIGSLWQIEEIYATLMSLELHQQLHQEKPYVALAAAKTKLQSMTIADLIEYINTLSYQVEYYRKNTPRIEQPKWWTVGRKLNEYWEYLKQEKDKHGSEYCPFNNPYYQAAFICQGL